MQKILADAKAKGQELDAASVAFALGYMAAQAGPAEEAAPPCPPVGAKTVRLPSICTRRGIRFADGYPDRQWIGGARGA